MKTRGIEKEVKHTARDMTIEQRAREREKEKERCGDSSENASV
jgi:hypothetical protein